MNTRTGALALLVFVTMLSGCTTSQARRGDPLTESNGRLRVYFNEARNTLLERETFVLVGGDEAYFYRAGQRTVVPYTPASYHHLKAVAHIPLSIYGLFTALGEGPYDDGARRRIMDFGAMVMRVDMALLDYTFDQAQAKRQRKITRESLDLIAEAAAERRLPRARLDAFCAEMRRPVLANAYEASRGQLEGLNAAVTQWMAALTGSERKSFHAVIALSHQAREDNLQAHYFRALFDEAGPVEERIVLAEGVFDEQGMKRLLGTHILDGGASRVFFGDDKRLQRDLLGDAAREIVATLTLPK